MNIDIKGLFGDISQKNNLTLIGHCFLENNRLSIKDLKFFLDDCIESKDFKALEQLNGFFSIIYYLNNEIYLISDKVRSRPIFYSFKGGWKVSDDFYSLVSKENSVNQSSKLEFLRTGYVTSNETLINGVFQVEAAQIVKITNDTQPVRKNYWYFIPEKNIVNSTNISYWFNKIDEALDLSIKRLINIADGRTIVIPLSGGYDSRAIALYLKKNGYQNLLAFTFGKKNSHEIKMSKKIADALHIQWHYVEYSKSMWQSIQNTSEFKRYRNFISSGTSVSNIVVYPALQKLLKSGIIDSNSLVAPGHTGDFLAGGHFSKQDLIGIQSATKQINSIAHRHYSLTSTPLPNKVLSKLTNVVNELNSETRADPLPVSELWNARERQSKFIVNSCRYYDFFNLDWWMPLWDNEFISLWESVPYSLRLNSELWSSFINHSMQHFIGKNAPTGRSDPKANLITKNKKRLNYFFDPNSLFALMPFDRWLFTRVKLSKKTNIIFGLLAEDYIMSISDLENIS